VGNAFALQHPPTPPTSKIIVLPTESEGGVGGVGVGGFERVGGENGDKGGARAGAGAGAGNGGGCGEAGVAT